MTPILSEKALYRIWRLLTGSAAWFGKPGHKGNSTPQESKFTGFKLDLAWPVAGKEGCDGEKPCRDKNNYSLYQSQG